MSRDETIAGSLAGGNLYDLVGMASLLRVCAAVTAAALLAFIVVPTTEAQPAAGA